MKRGHVIGTRRVSRKAQAWYDKYADEWIKKIEKEAAAKQHAALQQAAS